MGQFGQITHTHTYVVPFHTRKLFITLRVNSPSFSGRTVPLFDTMLIQHGEGSGTPTEPHHTPSLEAQPSSHTYISSPTLPTVTTISTAPIPTVTPSETTPLRQYTRRARIAQSSALPPVADEPTSSMRDVSQEEELEREAQRMNAQIARDEEIAKIHAEEELQQMIEGEAAWLKRKGIRPEQESTKKQKTSEEVPEEVKSFDDVSEEKLKELIRLVPIEEVYVEALQVKHPIIDWKVELKRLYEPDVEDHLWTHTQHIMHALIEWRLYDTCGVHHAMFKDLEIFMLVEKNYPLRKALALVMICYKLQVENYSQMATDLVRKIQQIADGASSLVRIVGNKMHKAFPLPVIEFPLPEELLTSREDSCHCQKKREATSRKIALLSMSKRNCQSKVAVTVS
nr:hypothetical protein [Tanacetum cinerariifolium]